MTKSMAATSPLTSRRAFGRFPLSPILLSFLSIACTNRITPPPAPADGVTVYLLDHGRHPSLVLPRPDGNLTRYVYGQWSWYATGNTSLLVGAQVIFCCSQGTLGRRLFESEDIQSVLDLDGAVHLYAIRVDRAAADSLRDALDAIFEANLSTLRANADYHLDFVHHPQPYSSIHSCNHVMVVWLRSLGCDVRGSGFLSCWRIASRS